MFYKEINKIFKSKMDFIVYRSENLFEFSKISYSQFISILYKLNTFFFNIKLSNKKIKILTVLPNSLEQLSLFMYAMTNRHDFFPLQCDITNIEFNKIVNLYKPNIIFIGKENKINSFKYSKITFVIEKIDSLEFIKKLNIRKYNFKKKAKLIISSSGTTGIPKIIQHDIDNLWRAAKTFSKFYNLKSSKKQLFFWNYLPMSYLGGLFNLTLIPLTNNSKIFITNGISGEDLINFGSTIQRLNINVLWFVPTVVRLLLSLNSKRNHLDTQEFFKDLFICFVGMAPISIKEKKSFYKQFSIKLIENYGLSECLFISFDNKKDFLKKGVGEIVNKVEIKIEKSTKKISVKSPYMMNGYLNSELKAIKKPNTWFDTFDHGYLKNGRLILTGRDKDIVKKSGILINLNQIVSILNEEFLNECEFACKKVDIPLYGDSFYIYCCNLNKVYSKAYIEDKIYSILPKSKYPEKIIFIKKIHKTASGKVILSKLK